MRTWLRWMFGGWQEWRIPPAHPTVPIRSPRHGHGPRKRVLPRVVLHRGVR